MDQAKLTALFRKLGANEPKLWASSQIKEGIPQLWRFLFLRQAWRAIVDENDSKWIGEAIERSIASPSDFDLHIV